MEFTPRLLKNYIYINYGYKLDIKEAERIIKELGTNNSIFNYTKEVFKD